MKQNKRILKVEKHLSRLETKIDSGKPVLSIIWTLFKLFRYVKIDLPKPLRRKIRLILWKVTRILNLTADELQNDGL